VIWPRRTERVGPKPSRARRYALATFRWRWPIIGAWALALSTLLVLPPVADSGNELASIIPLDSPAISAELRSVQEFGFPLTSRNVVVQRDASGLSPYVQAESVLDGIALDQGPKPAWPLLGAIPLTNSLRLTGRTGETNTAVLTYLFMDPVASFASQQDAASRYVSAHLERPEDHVVGVAGSVPARAQQAALVADNLPRLELLTVLAVFVLVGLTFRSLVAPVVALVAAGLSFIVTVHASRLLGGVLGISTPAELEPLLVALLLGVVTDYTIFYVMAFRSRIPQTARIHDAVVDAVTTDTPIVAAAGVTVAAGTAALLAASSEFFRAFGPAMALAVIVGLGVSVTLVPAMLAVLGRWVFWPGHLRTRSRRGRHVAPRRAHRRVLSPVRHLTNRAVAVAVVVVGVMVLGLPSLAAHELQLGVGFTSSLPADNPVAQASRAAADAFAPGITSPTTLLLEEEGITGMTDQLVALQRLVEQEPGVAGVVGPAQNFTGSAYNIVLATSGDAARMLVILKSDPLDATAISDLGALRDRLPDLARRSGLTAATISIAGDTALAQGLVSSTGADLVRIAVAGIIVNLLLLVLFLRALVAPLFLLASSVLALTASLGLTVWLFMHIIGNEGLTFYVPFAAAVLLVSLGSDYNIFGVGRIWAEAARMPLPDAVAKAVPESSRAITSAGFTLAVSFGMLVLIPLTPFRELAFAMTVGILVDAFLVRSLIVPSLLVIVGRWSGWPGPNLRPRSRRA
jgi:RND superfamily putative drug exporter